ncbi:substance-P receptor-like [Stylophora pistillata]|uniref:substance-P receptor-like n=1 Tax=Stylophora pistillata TaxID=50429 RepID=UPI000C04C5EF|nr:substance-P receptor-like [Stylophora pistillata]
MNMTFFTGNCDVKGYLLGGHNSSNEAGDRGNMSTTIKETNTKFQGITFLMYLGHAILFLASLFGNSLIIHIIRTNSSLKTTTNQLILHQAFTDVLITFVQLMNAIHYNSYRRLWFGGSLGNFTCKLFLTSLIVLPDFSIWILAMIGIDRYYAVSRPLQRSPVSRHLKKVIMILWVWSFLTSTKLFIEACVERHNTSYYCDLEITLNRGRKFNAFGLAFNIILPVLVILIVYTRICNQLWSRKVPGEGSNQNRMQAEVIATARKVTRMMIFVVFLFLVCWLPILITMAMLLFDLIQYEDLLFPLWLTVVYSALNPYFYFACSGNFRNAAKLSLGNVRVLRFRSQSIELQQV